jgi:hypothetical protein
MKLFRRPDFEIHPLAPWLWGRTVDGLMSGGAYDMWTVRTTPTSISIEPDLRSYRLMLLIMLAATAIFPPLFVYLIAGSRLQEMSDYPLIGVCVAIPCLLPTIIFFIAGVTARRRGPMLQYDLVTGVARLPRFGLSTRRGRPIRFQLIRSVWTKQSGRCNKMSTELHLIIQRRNGRTLSAPIIGTRGLGKKIAKVANSLATAMKIPIESSDDTTDYRAIAIVLLSTRCVNCRYNLRGNVSGVCPECGTPIPTPLMQPRFN